MTRQEKRQMAAQGADRVISDLRRSNAAAEAAGAPKVPDTEYEKLRRELTRKLVRA